MYAVRIKLGIPIFLVIVLTTFLVHAQINVEEIQINEVVVEAPQQHGYINANVGASPTISDVPQPVSLYGCNNTVVETQVYWDTQNQVLGGIPYGVRQSDSGKEYKVSKYYIASPPAWRSKKQTENSAAKKEAQPFIGLVTPDIFAFSGPKPAQIVDFDYRILMPTYLKNVPVDFSWSDGDQQSCADQGVTSIPINTVCPDFPWRIGTQGASGIGLLNTSGSTAFLPFLEKDSNPLQCSTTLVNDIMLDHQVFFATEKGRTETINLTQYHAHQKTMKLVCVKRPKDDIPQGCL